MSVTPTAGIAAAWSAAKPDPNQQAVRPPVAPGGEQAGRAPETAPAEEPKGSPAPDGQGQRIDIRV